MAIDYTSTYELLVAVERMFRPTGIHSSTAKSHLQVKRYSWITAKEAVKWLRLFPVTAVPSM